MALEKRGENFYYYKKERERNRVVSKYYGTGELASLIAQMDEIERDEKQCKALERRETRRKLEAIDLELAEIERNVKILTECYLTGKGFYKTTSREWRIKANEK